MRGNNLNIYIIDTSLQLTDVYIYKSTAEALGEISQLWV